jgi:hypothetical protein
MWTTLNMGPLPVGLVQRCLGIELPPGLVEFSAHAQEHAFTKEPAREPVCRPHLLDVVARPTHIGQEPGYVGDAFYLVRQVPGNGPIVLVAIGLKPLRSRMYGVRSTYPLDLGTLQRRIRRLTCVPI